MRPGPDCIDSKLNFAMEASKNWVQFALNLPMASPLGRNFTYCTPGPHILPAILTRVTHMSTQEHARSRLFGPLRITPGDYTWDKDPRGISISGYGISMKPENLARFGLLYLNGGEWDGVQVVPQEWRAAEREGRAMTPSETIAYARAGGPQEA